MPPRVISDERSFFLSIAFCFSFCYQREGEYHRTEHDEYNTRRAVERARLGTVSKHRRDARPQQSKYNAEHKHGDIGRTAYDEMRHRTRERGKRHNEHARTP